MKLNKLGPNATEIVTAKGIIVLFSYSTPVAAELPDGSVVRTSQHWSSTTSKHINKWLEGRSARTMGQEYINNLVK